MSGGLNYGSAMLSIGEHMALVEKRVKAWALNHPMATREMAYMAILCEMEHEVWQASKQRKLDDIRDHGT